MSLLQEAAAIGVKKGPVCSVATLKAANPSIIAELDEAMASPLVTSNAIRQALMGRGITLSAETLQRHRRKACQCPR